MRFFTNGTWRPRDPEIKEVPAPVGESCLSCASPIGEEDCGLLIVHMGAQGDAYRPWHLACFRRSLGIEGVGNA